jgi:phospholipid transport system transporter-binding protein
MSDSQFKKMTNGDIAVSGTLGFNEVETVLNDSHVFFDGQADLVFDLDQVDKTDSAGLALLLDWMKMAKKSGQSIGFKKIPKQMLDIAHVSGLDDILPIV